jgi:hypothetical protein
MLLPDPGAMKPGSISLTKFDDRWKCSGPF